MKKILLILMVVFLGMVIFSASLKAAEGVPDVTYILTIEDAPENSVAEPDNSDVGFFEKLVVGIFDFIVSENFTRFCTALAMLAAAIYPFLKKWLSIKAQVKYNRAVIKLANAKEEAEKRKQAALTLAKIADNSIKSVSVIKEALIIGFDKSNLKMDVKDKVMNILNSVSIVDSKELDAAVAAVLEDEIEDDTELKNNLSTEGLEKINLEPSKGW